MSENERNYESYGRNSIVEEEESEFVHDDLTYGQDAIQDRFSLCKLRSYFLFVLNMKSLTQSKPKSRKLCMKLMAGLAPGCPVKQAPSRPPTIVLSKINYDGL